MEMNQLDSCLELISILFPIVGWMHFLVSPRGLAKKKSFEWRTFFSLAIYDVLINSTLSLSGASVGSGVNTILLICVTILSILGSALIVNVMGRHRSN